SFDDVHVTVVVRFWVMPSVKVPVAVKGTGSPTKAMGFWGESVRATRSAGVTVTCAVAVLPFRLAVIVAVPTPLVRTGKSAKSAPAGIGTVAGTEATPIALLVSATSRRAGGAGETVTRRTPGLPFGSVSVAGVSPVTTVGGGVTCTVALTLLPLIAALTRVLPGVMPV